MGFVVVVVFFLRENMFQINSRSSTDRICKIILIHFIKLVRSRHDCMLVNSP